MKQSREKQDGLVETHSTDLSCGNDVFIFRVLVDGQREDVVSVFQVETLSSCSRKTHINASFRSETSDGQTVHKSVKYGRMEINLVCR